MKDLSKFQLILMIVFGTFIFFGVLIFSLGKFSTTQNVVKVTVWGFLSSEDFSLLIEPAGLKDNPTIEVEYFQKKEATFDNDFVEALASQKGPDLFFLSQDAILKHKSKIFPIPDTAVSVRGFKDAFIQEGELYLTAEGVLGLPFIIDPMVMYWNRDIFSNAGISVPPRFWSEFYDVAPKLTIKDGSLNVTQSTVALGEYTNVSHATDLFSLLIMQAGGLISTLVNGEIQSALQYKFDAPVLPAILALNFYTEFTNPVKLFYSWNRSIPVSKDFFIRGNLAMYFGYASEIKQIADKNPNLNFDVAKIPQSSQTSQKTTFGKMYALAIPKTSRNINSAIGAAMLLVSNPSIAKLTEITHLPPVRRDLLSIAPTSDYLAVFYESAIQSRAWLQPNKSATDAIFKEMIESVTGGRSNVNNSVSRANLELNLLFKNTK